MFKRTILALSVAALAMTGVAQAQENATLTLRSGERISGQLVDMGGSGFAVRVSGQDRNIPTSEVAVIDFSGSAATDADWAKVTDGQQLLVLKDGDYVDRSTLRYRRYVTAQDHVQDQLRRSHRVLVGDRAHRARTPGGCVLGVAMPHSRRQRAPEFLSRRARRGRRRE